jgi:hypothetical protein
MELEIHWQDLGVRWFVLCLMGFGGEISGICFGS